MDDDGLIDLLADCHDDPGMFHEAILDRPPLHAKQEAIAKSVVRNRITVVPAAHAVGKSWYAATAVLHWLYTRPDSKVITTSASNVQLTAVLWGAIKAAWSRSPIQLDGTISQGNAIPQRIEVAPDWYAIGFSAGRAENFSGFHGDDILVIVDESSGVEQPIWDAIESLGYTSLLALGNPIRASGHFRALWGAVERGDDGYAGFHLTAFDSPHAGLTDGQVKAKGLPRGLTTKTWIDRVRVLYGEASLYWKTRVLAEFPDEDHDRLIPDSWIDRCVLSRRTNGVHGGLRWLAMDVSKGTGRDRTVAFVGDALGLLACEVSNRIDLPGAANLAATLSRRWGVPHDQITYDAGGWAGPELGRYLEAVGITTARPYFGSASGKARFANQRSRSGWALRQRLTPDRPFMLDPPRIDPHSFLPEISRNPTPIPPTSDVQPPFVIPPEVIGPHWGDLREELQALRYSHDAKIELEPKADLVARLGRSPDLADTLLMAASPWRV